MGPEFAKIGTRGMMPLFIEATAIALVGFAVGLLAAYLVALRRRSAQGRRF